jgi:hypothetical protein
MLAEHGFDVFLALALLLWIAFIWMGILRPFALRLAKISLYRLRDDLRNWYIDLPMAQKEKQRFSFLFMERAINSIADSPEDITVWTIKLLQELRIFGRGFPEEFDKEINRFTDEHDAAIESIDEQHTLIFYCLLFVNSPLSFSFYFVATICNSLLAPTRSGRPLEKFSQDAKTIREASHQQSSHWIATAHSIPT